MRHGFRQGFTFVELMTVMAIILILAAILFPVFARAREKGYQSSCAANLQNIGIALRIYAAEHYGHFPPRDNDLWALVPRCLPDPEALACPTATSLARLSVRLGFAPVRPAPSGVPAGPVAALSAGPPPEPEGLLTDGTVPGRRLGPEGRPIDYIYRGGLCDDDDPRTPLAGDSSDNRHNGGTSYLFLDGHVKWYRRDFEDAELDALRKLGHVTPREPPDDDEMSW